MFFFPLSHCIITNMYDVFHMFFPTKFVNVFPFNYYNFVCVLVYFTHLVRTSVNKEGQTSV